jgi:hypothetical protein
MTLSTRALVWRLGAAWIVAWASSASADNAGFALAPKESVLAVDARGISDLLDGPRGALVRPVLEAFAGSDALGTFDVLAKRANAPGEKVARDVFSGRIAFFLPSADPGAEWLLGFESDDQRCEHVLRMLSAKMSAPGRFESAGERLAMRRVGGWLLIAPSTERGRALIDESAVRVPVEDPATSLLGEPLMQDLLASDAPVRVFMRHAGSLGGATAIALRGAKLGFHAEVAGNYESAPFGLTPGRHALDAHLVRALEDRAVMVLSNPADGVPSKSDAFWVALLPEIVPPPAMRTNLAGERVLMIGMSADTPMPTLACAWRIEDAEQAKADQDHFMKGVCCALGRTVEQPRSDQKESDPARDRATAELAEAQIAERRCAELGPFADRYLGRPLKLGTSVLCWSTVETPCGGWQVYSSDPRWLADVTERLASSSCSGDARPSVGGIGFCDGVRASAMLRRWQPLVEPRPDALTAPKAPPRPAANDRISRGILALSDMMERLGRVRFRYEMPSPTAIRAHFEVEPQGRLGEPARRSMEPKPGAPRE